MRKWTAFLRLKGETWTSKEDEILDTFEGLVRSLRGVDIDYNIIVFVEGNDPRLLGPPNRVQRPETMTPRERSGA